MDTLILALSKKTAPPIHNIMIQSDYSVIITITTSHVKIDTLKDTIKITVDIRQIGSQKNTYGLNGSYCLSIIHIYFIVIIIYLFSRDYYLIIARICLIYA